jgi:hypothetical protein
MVPSPTIMPSAPSVATRHCLQQLLHRRCARILQQHCRPTFQVGKQAPSTQQLLQQGNCSRLMLQQLSSTLWGGHRDQWCLL